MSSSTTSNRGALIILEGLDRSGKSTQVQRLVDCLQAQGVQAKAARFPDRSTAIGSTINAYLASGQDLDDHAIHLLFSANRWEAARQMQADLQAGITLIVDRYSFSGVAFTHAKSAKNSALSLDWCIAPDVGLLTPDLVLFLAVSPQVAKQRGGFGEERYETESMQLAVREAFDKVRQRATASGVRWRQVNADQEMDQVQQEISQEAQQVLQSVRDEATDPKWDLWRPSS